MPTSNPCSALVKAWNTILTALVITIARVTCERGQGPREVEPRASNPIRLGRRFPRVAQAVQHQQRAACRLHGRVRCQRRCNMANEALHVRTHPVAGRQVPKGDGQAPKLTMQADCQLFA